MNYMVKARHPDSDEWFNVIDEPVATYIEALGELRHYNETAKDQQDRVQIVVAETGKILIETDAWMH